MKKLMTILFLLPLSSFALDPEAASIGNLLNLDLSTGPTVDCFDPQVTPECTEINKSYCRNLKTSGGKLNDATGVVNLGQSERSQLSQIERAGLDDLVRAQSRLPEDIRRALANPIRDLTQILARENDSKDWYRDLARVRAKIADKIKDISHDRADRRIRGTNPTSADRSAERDEEVRVVNDMITRARMESSPNWPRLVEVFSLVKRDMISTVNTLSLTDAEKTERIARINSTNLSFPFAVKMGGVLGEIRENDCRTNMVNAMYIPLNGSLTVCAGLLNAFQSENALYFVLAHELAHSFNLRQIQTISSSPRGRALEERLLETNANIACDEYARLKTETATRPEDYQCGRDAYNTFANCLSGNSPLPASAVGQRNMGLAASVLLNLDVCSIANRNSGQAYMNPNVFADRNFAKLMTGPSNEYAGSAIPSGRSMMNPVYRLTQELRCSPAGTPCMSVLATTAEAVVAEAPTPPQCLATAESSQENEADWYAHKSMIMRMRNTTDLRERRQMIATGLGMFCGFMYLKPLTDKEQERVEKELERLADQMNDSFHSPDNSRNTNVMTEEVAGLLQCNRTNPDDSKNYQACRL